MSSKTKSASKKKQYPAMVWPKNLTRPCPGKCGHKHLTGSGPCIEIGCGCNATKQRKVK